MQVWLCNRCEMLWAISKNSTNKKKIESFCQGKSPSKPQFLKTNCEINIAIAHFQKCFQEEAIVFVTSRELGTSFV